MSRVRPTATGGTDRYGQPVLVDVTVVLEERAAFDPGTSVEPLEVGRASIVTKPSLYFQGTWPDIHEGDRLIFRGQTYEVEGRPKDYRSPWGTGVGGLVVELEEVTG